MRDFDASSISETNNVMEANNVNSISGDDFLTHANPNVL